MNWTAAWMCGVSRYSSHFITGIRYSHIHRERISFVNCSVIQRHSLDSWVRYWNHVNNDLIRLVPTRLVQTLINRIKWILSLSLSRPTQTLLQKAKWQKPSTAIFSVPSPYRFNTGKKIAWLNESLFQPSLSFFVFPYWFTRRAIKLQRQACAVCIIKQSCACVG